MTILYARSGGGTWANAVTWSTTGSGGAAAPAAPTAADDVIFELGSGNVTVAAGAVCRSLDCTSGSGNYTGVLTFNNFVGISLGDGTSGANNVALKLSSGMTLTLAGANAFTFVSTSGTPQTITTAGKTLISMTFNAVGGSWSFSDTVNTGNTTLTNGTLDTNSQAVITGGISSNNSNTRILTLGTSIITLTNTSGTPWNFATATNLTMNAASSIINITDVGTSSKTFAGGGKTYGTLNITTGGSGAIVITGANIFIGITTTGGTTKTITLPGSLTTTLTGSTPLPSGALSNLITFIASSGSATVLFSEQVSCDYISLTNIVATGNIPAYAGTNSVDGGGNTNWEFTNPPEGSSSSFNKYPLNYLLMT